MFPDYNISIDDKRFPRVYAKWATDTMMELWKQAPDPYYIEKIEYWIGCHDKTLPEALRSDIKKMLRKYANTGIDVVMLAYGINTFSIAQIQAEIETIQTRKVKNDYILSSTSAVAFTANLHTDLLDELIPAVNLVAIQFTRERTYL
jgi:hypothetical protein